MLVVRDRVIHEVATHERGGCCDEHPYDGYTAFCYDCDESVGDGYDWSGANEMADEHINETARTLDTDTVSR